MTDLHQLLVVQEHDTALDQLRHRRSRLPERAVLQACHDEQSQLRARAAQQRAAQQQAAAREAVVEAELAQIEAKQRALRAKLATAAVPREIEALQHELDGLTTRQGEHEDEALGLMELLDPIADELAQAGGAEERLQERLIVAEAELAEAEAALDAEVATHQAAREEAARELPAVLLATYDKLRARLGGIGVAHLDHGRCSGCNLVLPTREIERLRTMSPDALPECEQCGRLLVAG